MRRYSCSLLAFHYATSLFATELLDDGLRVEVRVGSNFDRQPAGFSDQLLSLPATVTLAESKQTIEQTAIEQTDKCTRVYCLHQSVTCLNNSSVFSAAENHTVTVTAQDARPDKQPTHQ
jgi:hypothetical protein|eukprot:COSAG01_NODE_2812_length_7030_cov_2621.373106_4_plen_119_part_00